MYILEHKSHTWVWLLPKDKNPKTKITGSKGMNVVRLLIHKMPKHALETVHKMTSSQQQTRHSFSTLWAAWLYFLQTCHQYSEQRSAKGMQIHTLLFLGTKGCLGDSMDVQFHSASAAPLSTAHSPACLQSFCSEPFQHQKSCVCGWGRLPHPERWCS